MEPTKRISGEVLRGGEINEERIRLFRKYIPEIKRGELCRQKDSTHHFCLTVIKNRNVYDSDLLECNTKTFRGLYFKSVDALNKAIENDSRHN